MTEITRRRTLRQWAGAALVLAASGFGVGPAAAGCGDSGFGGTGHAEPGSGFGGTGLACEGEVVGVAGVITGFGSIFVAGAEIHYDDDFTLDTPTGPAGTGALGLGQQVAVRARMHHGRLEAQHIALAPTLVGPVQASDADTLRVAGQTVRLAATTQRVNWPHAVPAAGQWLTVHGLRAPDGTIVATRVVARPPAAEVYVEGVPEALADGVAHIAGLTVRLPVGRVPGGDGAPQAYTGVLDAQGVLQARAVRPAPVTRMLDALPPGARVIGENLLPPQPGGAVPPRLFGRPLTIEAHTLTPAGPLPGSGYARITAQLLGGVLHALSLDAAPASAWPGLVYPSGTGVVPVLDSVLAPVLDGVLAPWPVLAPPIEYPMPPDLPGPLMPERSLQAPWWPGAGGWQPNGRLGR